MEHKKDFRIGDWVEVCAKEEILQTLDSKGMLDGMPFMPEMFAFCGLRFRVYKSAHKTCDYSAEPYCCRNLPDTVHLQTRCSGEAHGGCQAACLLYWKTAWLKPVASGAGDATSSLLALPSDTARKSSQTPGCTEKDIWNHVQEPETDDGTPTYICQMTQIRSATTPLAWWDIRQYMRDYASGNVTLGRILSGLIYWIYFSLSEAGIGVGRPMRWFYNKFSSLWGGTGFPRENGLIPEGLPTPLVNLNLQPAEFVRIKSQKEILKTVATSNKNRGMYWDAELVPYCGKVLKVRSRVTRLIGERSRKMLEMKNPCITLESVVCQARYSSCRMFCPKEMYPYWREAWLERVEPSAGDAVSQMKETAASARQ
jgi:hypothetical protein